MPRQAGQRRRHQGHAEQGDQAHAQQAGRELSAGQTCQGGGHGQEGGPVGGAGVLPHGGDLVGERATEHGGPVGVDVHVGVGHGALREVAVDVPAEQRRCEQQRGRPHGEHQQQGARGGRLGAAHQAAEEHPGGDEQHDTEVHPDQTERGLGRGGAQQVLDGQGTGCLTAQREGGGAGQPEQLAAAEIDGECHGQHWGSVSTPDGRKATVALPGGGGDVTGECGYGAGRGYAVACRPPGSRLRPMESGVLRTPTDPSVS